GVTLTARYAVPTLSAIRLCRQTGACNGPAATCASGASGLTPGQSSLRLSGSGFGLAGECRTAGACPTTWCPTTGTTFPTGATVTFTGGATVSAQLLNAWSDTIVWVQVPAAAQDGPVTVTTPYGSVTTAAVNICP